MPEPMNDNARIVREVIALFANLHPWPLHKDQRAEIDRGLAALAALETELATAKADLERAREEERDRVIAIMTGWDGNERVLNSHGNYDAEALREAFRAV